MNSPTIETVFTALPRCVVGGPLACIVGGVLHAPKFLYVVVGCFVDSKINVSSSVSVLPFLSSSF